MFVHGLRISHIFASILLTTTIQLYYHHSNRQKCLDYLHLLPYIVVMVCICHTISMNASSALIVWIDYHKRPKTAKASDCSSTLKSSTIRNQRHCRRSSRLRADCQSCASLFRILWIRWNWTTLLVCWTWRRWGWWRDVVIGYWGNALMCFWVFLCWWVWSWRGFWRWKFCVFGELGKCLWLARAFLNAFKYRKANLLTY